MKGEGPFAGTASLLVWYQFIIDRKGEHPQGHLNGYKGWIHAGGYAGVNGLFGEDNATGMACMAHIRRVFVDIHASQGSSIEGKAIQWMQDYEITRLREGCSYRIYTHTMENIQKSEALTPEINELAA
ncbi:Transposase IS66 family protein [Pseudovibrio sp. Ad14]|nr:Transposase IS66 family protein [Pseudovibrio sp. W74]KZL07174.1 Transposase IS66 family protein [Pseudovibrio sp. Ad14]